MLRGAALERPLIAVERDNREGRLTKARSKVKKLYVCMLRHANNTLVMYIYGYLYRITLGYTVRIYIP